MQKIPIQHRLLIAFSGLFLGLNGCSSSHPNGMTPPAGTATAYATPTPTPNVTSRKIVVSPMQAVLMVFASPQPVPWAAFDGLRDVVWRDTHPQANPDATEPDLGYDRSGSLMLNGFGMVDVPDGQIGADAGTKRDNEGHVGITLSGNAATVQSIALLKFYPSEHYQDILQHQLDSHASIQLIANTCVLDYGATATNNPKNAFYRIDLGEAPRVPIYVEAFIDDGEESHGPGSTTFVFYRTQPSQRMKAMHCKER